jgi:hypothetical protein
MECWRSPVVITPDQLMRMAGYASRANILQGKPLTLCQRRARRHAKYTAWIVTLT